MGIAREGPWKRPKVCFVAWVAMRGAIYVLNCMIALYGQHGHCRKAMELFQEMARRGLTADACTLASVQLFTAAQDFHAGL
jgi:pentatricopeptide repeat protein